MIPLGILGQVYAVCASIGVIFIFANVALGQLGEMSSDDSGAGSDFGAADDGGAGSDFGAADDGGIGSDFGAAHVRISPISTPEAPTASRFATKLGAIILGLLSPMNMAIYLAFFGLTGLLLGFTCPWLGLLTIIPSLLMSLLVAKIFKLSVRWMVKNMHSSSHARDADLIGQIAEVNTPIQDGRIGEITYVNQSKRLNYSAKPAKAGIEFKKGSKVLIVGTQDHMVLVEPCDPELEERFVS